jgi:ribosome maturation protein SDO1
MSRQINQPINQVKLTNVAVVKYSYKGKRFEIACYRNKVMDFRSGFERDLSEVLQSERIFTNVSKGQFAKSSDLESAFGTKDEAAIAKTILERGEFQLTDLERQQLLESALSQIATQIAANCVNPDTNRPYSVSQIRTALSNYHLQPHKPMKKQYLDAIKFLKQSSSLPIERAKMELALKFPASSEGEVRTALEKLAVDVVQHKSGPGLIVAHVDPSVYRDLNDLAGTIKGARLEILQQAAIVEAVSGGAGNDSSLLLPIQESLRDVASKQSASERGDPESDEEQQELLHKLQALGILREDNDDGQSDADADADAAGPVAPRNRKQARQQQKKDKKTQRRNADDSGATRTSEGGPKQGVDGENDDTVQHGDGGGDGVSSDAAAKSCNTCGGSFPSMSAYRAHFRSDWHRFNQKLKLKGIPAVSEEEFRLCDSEAFFGGKDDD